MEPLSSGRTVLDGQYRVVTVVGAVDMWATGSFPVVHISTALLQSRKAGLSQLSRMMVLLKEDVDRLSPPMSESEGGTRVR